MTQLELAERAGVHITTIKRYEAMGNDFKVRQSYLDAILTVMAQKTPLGPSEIKIVSDATGRHYESIESINAEAERKLRAVDKGSASSMRKEASVEDQAIVIVHQIIAAGGGELMLAQLKAMASHYGEQIAEQERTPRRRFQVHHPERQVGDLTVQDISHYEVDEDDDGPRAPRQLRPIDEPKSPAIDPADDTDSNNHTGS